ncbi:MAG: ATP synthase F1 subunit delta [Acidimicrobiia bacterium]
MTDQDRVDAYATAAYETAVAEGALEAVEDELFRFARVLEGSDDLRMTLTDAATPIERRMAVVEQLLGGRAHQVTASFVLYVVGAGRARDLPAIADALVAKAATRKESAVAEVRSAVELDDATQQRVAQALSDATGQQITVKVVVDPAVMGGLVARIGDTVIDGTVRHRLEELKERI